MIRTKQIQRELDTILSDVASLDTVCGLLRRSSMMINNYRNRDNDPLPAITWKGKIVGYVLDDVREWARRNNLSWERAPGCSEGCV